MSSKYSLAIKSLLCIAWSVSVAIETHSFSDPPNNNLFYPDSTVVENEPQTQYSIANGQYNNRNRPTQRDRMETHSFDGRDNNRMYREWGAANTARIRNLPPSNVVGFVDGLGTPANETNSNLPSARRVMERIFRMAKPSKDKPMNHLMLEFGHFVVQDVMANTFNNDSESFPIPCDGQLQDIMFCPATGKSYKNNVFEDGNDNHHHLDNYDSVISFHRREHVQQSLTTPRATMQGQTHFLDLSNVYGSTPERVKIMRGGLDGGLLEMTEDGLVPRDNIYWGGMNTSPGAFALYIVFMRYHNLMAVQFAKDDPSLTGDELFLMARQKTIAVYQSIVEEKYVPSLLGEKLDPYDGYSATVNPSIDEFFASVGFRYAHSAFSGLIRMLDEDFRPIPEDPLFLRDVFKKPEPNDVPSVVKRYGGIEPFLRGLLVVAAKAVDGSIVDDLNLWSEATSVLDVQRARDVGIPSYNDARVAFGLAPMKSMEELLAFGGDGDDDDMENMEMVATLKDLYSNNISKVDAYVGALLEPHETTMDSMGPLLSMSIKDQFTRLRDGDRFWYKNIYTAEEYESFPTMSEIIRQVCDGMTNFPEDSFKDITASVGQPEEEGSCQASSSSQLSVLGGAFFIGWQVNDPAQKTSRQSQGKDRTIELTLRANEELEGPGFIGVGWGAKTMLGSEIWFCTVNDDVLSSPSNNLVSSECPASDNNNAAMRLGQDEEAALFSCCVAPGTQHNVPRCADEKDAIYYDLEITNWCLTMSSFEVTIRAPVCDKSAESQEEVRYGATNNNNERNCFPLASTPEGKMDFILAYNPLAQNRPHGFQRRTSAQVDLFGGMLTQSETQIADDGLIAVHGLFMLISWMILAPAAIFIIRFMKTKKWHMVAHVTIMGIVGSLMIPLLIGIEASVGATIKRSNHKIVGLSLLLVYFCMVAAGRLRYVKLTGRKIGRKLDFVSHVFHRYVGLAIVFVSWYNCYTGLDRMSSADSGGKVFVLSTISVEYDMPIFEIIRDRLFFPYICLVGLVFFVAEWRKRRNFGFVDKERFKAVIEGSDTIWDDDGRHLEVMTMQSFLDVSRHTELCVVDGRVLDITDFMDVHPGGRELLRYAQGSDITEELLGRRDVDGIKHAHGVGAIRLLKRLVKAKLDQTTSTSLQSIALCRGSVKQLGSRNLISTTTAPPKPELPEAQLRRPSQVFLPCKVVSAKYLTPSIPMTEESRPVIWLRLSVSRKDRKCRTPTPGSLVPSSVYVFRGKDDRGRLIERQYTPVVLNGKFQKINRDSRSFLHMPSFLENNNDESEEENATEAILDFIISLVPGGQMSKHFLSVKPGKLILCNGPFINKRELRILKGDWDSVVMLAAGTGISPMLQIVDGHMNGNRHLLEDDSEGDSSFYRPYPRMFLVWILKSRNHNYADILGLDARARRSHGRFRFTIIYSSNAETPTNSDIGSINSGSEDDRQLATEGLGPCHPKSTETVSAQRGQQQRGNLRKTWSAGNLIDTTAKQYRLGKRLRATFKSTFAKNAMNVRDLIELTHRDHSSSKESEEEDSTRSSDSSFDRNANFWRRNGMEHSLRFDHGKLAGILQSVEDYVIERDGPSDQRRCQEHHDVKLAIGGGGGGIMDSSIGPTKTPARSKRNSLVLLPTDGSVLGSIQEHEQEDEVASATSNTSGLTAPDPQPQDHSVADIEQGNNQTTKGLLFPKMLVVMSGSPNFEGTMRGHLKKIGFPQDQITNFSKCKDTQ